MGFIKPNITGQESQVDTGQRSGRLQAIRSIFGRSSSKRRLPPFPERSNADMLQETQKTDTTVGLAPSPISTLASMQPSEMRRELAPTAVSAEGSQRSKLDEQIRTEGVIVDDDIWNSAYRRACARRNAEEQTILAKSNHVRELFAELEKETHEREETSLFQKGVKVIGPVLNGLNVLLNFTDPISNIDPSVTTSIAIVKAVIAIGIAICGAAQEMRSHIETLVRDLPRIDFCDALQIGRPGPEMVQNALTLVYCDLLDFFFRSHTLLRSRHFVLDIAKSHIRSDLSTIVSSFSNNIRILDHAINYATNQIAHDLAQNDVNREVRELLASNRALEIEHHDTLKIRADEACEWIISDHTVLDWLDVTVGSKIVVMYGDMGNGKTITVAYLVDFLRSSLNTCAAPLVCSYFCKDDGEMSQVRNVYRSLLSQLLASKVSLRWAFHNWYHERRGRNQIEPTQAINELRDLLLQLIFSLRQALYIVIDGFDECDDVSSAHLLGFLNQLQPKLDEKELDANQSWVQPGLVRVFISTRYTDLTLHMPNGTRTIKLLQNQQRDLCIVRHLTMRYLDYTTKQVQDLVTDYVAENMQGSAIWARMVLQYLRSSRRTKEASIRKTLGCLPPPKELSELYVKLFEKMIGNIQENRWILARSLDLLAASRRYLTVRELSYAVHIESVQGEKAKRLEDLQDDAEDTERVLQLIKPFVTVQESSDTNSAYLRLVHQSLKHFIMCKAPYEWTTTMANTFERKDQSREAELNGLALQLCIDYLLLEDFEENQLVPDPAEQDLRNEMLALAFYEESTEEKETDLGNINPYDRGFGGFYTYAACHWTVHYQHATQDYTPKLKDLIALSQPGSLRLRNWLDRMREPDWRVDLEWGARHDYNPLALVARFGSETSLKELLDQGLPAIGLTNSKLQSAATKAVAMQAVERSMFCVIRILLEYTTTASAMKDSNIFLAMASNWRDLDHMSFQSWDQLVDILIERFEDVLIHYGNWILLQAAQAGCLPLIQKLFEAAATVPQMMNSILQMTSDEWGPIGRAGSYGHEAVVRYLCEQKGIEPHLHHLNPNGDNIYHVIAPRGNADVLRVLIQHFPEGVDQSNGDTTPLQTAVNHAQSFEAVKVLLVEGQADVNAGEPYFMPLRCAVRNTQPALCRLLIVQGKANPWIVVSVSDTGIPYLTEHCNRPGAHMVEDERKILEEICALMPLAVSVAFLLPVTSC